MAKQSKIKVSARKFYRTRFFVEVLSEEEIPAHMSLGEVMQECQDGDYSGDSGHLNTKVLDGRQAAKALQKQGSDPGFFRLTAKGEDADD